MEYLVQMEAPGSDTTAAEEGTALSFVLRGDSAGALDAFVARLAARPRLITTVTLLPSATTPERAPEPRADWRYARAMPFAVTPFVGGLR